MFPRAAAPVSIDTIALPWARYRAPLGRFFGVGTRRPTARRSVDYPLDSRLRGKDGSQSPAVKVVSRPPGGWCGTHLGFRSEVLYPFVGFDFQAPSINARCSGESFFVQSHFLFC